MPEGLSGAIPLIFHASNVGEGSDEIPPPTIPDEEVPTGTEGPQKKPKRSPSSDEIVKHIQDEQKKLRTSPRKNYLDPAGIKTDRAFKEVTHGNPQVTAGGQTALGGVDPCIANSEQIAEMRGYGTEVKGNIKDLLNSSESIVPGVYETTLPPAHQGWPGRYHQVVVNEDGTLTDVSLNLNSGRGTSSIPPQPDTWELHDYYHNVIEHNE